ncbi:MAG TPA: hypothetical protein VMN38_10055 [Sphingomicrobium sp.]|nr:hypothetical protein [Sphingomicrobium sp.]
MGFKFAIAAAAALALGVPSAAVAQSANQAIVSIYQAAPGHQVALLKWLADRERIAAAAGVPASQLYVHQDGASWDYLLIGPATTAAQDDAMDAAATKMGLSAGPGVGIELRKHIASHTDTFVGGPMTVAAYLALIGEK